MHHKSKVRMTISHHILYFTCYQAGHSPLNMMGPYSQVLTEAKEGWDRWCRRKDFIHFLTSASLLPLEDEAIEVSIHGRLDADAVLKVVQSPDLLRYICSLL